MFILCANRNVYDFADRFSRLFYNFDIYFGIKPKLLEKAPERVIKAYCQLGGVLDRLEDYYIDRDYVEFRGTTGGDPLRYRVYNDGRVGEK